MNQGNKFYKTYDVKKISECHQSIGPKTLTPNSRLDRWSGVHNAISDWMINDADDEVAVKVAEENFQYYDPLKTVNISIWSAAGGLPGQLAGSPVGQLAALLRV